MAGLAMDHPWAFAAGVLGNILSFMVYLAPLPTFYRVYKKKTTDGFQAMPYVVALFSAMLWMYYAFLKTGAYLLITVNSAGCFIETIYIVMYLVYAPPKARIYTAKLILMLNVGLYSLILVLTLLLSKGSCRLKILGWFNLTFAFAVFVSPLSVIRVVIRTKSVEFLPFNLSLTLTVSAVAWFAYGALIKDLYVAIPNILGFIFGILQLVLYFIYKDKKKTNHELKLPEHKVADAKLSPSSTVDVHDGEANLTTPAGKKVNEESKGPQEAIELSPV